MDKKELVTRLLMICQTVDRLEDIGMALSGSTIPDEGIIRDFVDVRELLIDIVLDGVEKGSAEEDVMSEKCCRIIYDDRDIEEKAEMMMKIVDLI